MTTNPKRIRKNSISLEKYGNYCHIYKHSSNTATREAVSLTTHHQNSIRLTFISTTYIEARLAINKNAKMPIKLFEINMW